MIPWYRQKTTWTAIAGVVAAILGLFTEVLTPQQSGAIMGIIGSLAVIFVRQGIEKTKEDPNAKP